MKSLLIIGAGQYGQLAKELAEMNGYEKIDFLDDNYSTSIGKIEDLDKFQENYDETICAIGNAKIRKNISSKIKNKAVLINSKSYIAKSAIIGKGSIIEAGAIINTDVIIEEGCFICAGAVINHNSIVKKYSQVDCNAVVKGIVPEESKIECCEFWRG